MPLGRALSDIGSERASASYNVLRRFLPSAALALRVEPHETQTVGHWRDIPKGEGQPGSKRVAQYPMSRHYAQDPAGTAGEVIRQVVLYLCVIRHLQDASENMPGPPPVRSRMFPGSLTWAHVRVWRNQLGPLDTIDAVAAKYGTHAPGLSNGIPIGLGPSVSQP